VSNTILTIY